MKKQLFAFTAALGAMSILTAVPAFAMIRNLEINADLDNITEPSEHGVCFYPDYEVEEDEDVSVVFGTPQVINNGNPMYPATIPVVIHSDNEALDDDLKISGTGIRSTYIDSVSVDNAEASGRLQVYPLYILMDANPVLNTAAGTASWNSVPYAGKYEVLISYPKKMARPSLCIKRPRKRVSTFPVIRKAVQMVRWELPFVRLLRTPWLPRTLSLAQTALPAGII
jgi:hypothetical protein